MGVLTCFNPTLVRLRQETAARLGSDLFLFQSHAGSIEADKRNVAILALMASFNPTLVRLRPSPSPTARAALAVVSIPRWFD